MEITFTSPKVQAGRRYSGEITRYVIDPDKPALYVFVALNDEPELEYMKYFKLDMSIHSRLADFCDEMCIFTSEVTADLNELKGRRVVVRLTRSKGELYVDKIWLDEDYYDLYEEEGEEDE